MRKSGVMIVVMVLLMGFAIAHFLTAAWLERKIESAASDIVGARVEIDNFNASLFKLQVGWKRLQVTDPNNTWSNIIETGKVQFDVAAEPLLYKRLIIETLRLQNLQTGTKRKTDGKWTIKKKKPSNQPTFLDRAAKSSVIQLSKSSGIDFNQLNGDINVDTVIRMLDLQTPANVTAFEQDMKTTSDRWNKEVESFEALKKETEQIADQVKAIQFDELKTPDAILNAIGTIQTARKQVETIHSTIQIKKNVLVEDGKRLGTQVKSIDNWIKDDIKRAKAKAKLPDFSVKNIAFILLGPTLGGHIQTAQRYLKIAQHYQAKLPPKEPKVPKPPRFKGQDIPFPDYRHWPKFWLKKMVVSVGKDGLIENSPERFFAGSLEDLTTDQKITRRPMVLKVSRETGARADRYLLSIDRTDAEKKDRFEWHGSGINLQGISLAKNDLLPKNLDNGNMNVHLNLFIQNGILNGTVGIVANDLSFHFEDAGSGKSKQLREITHDLFRVIKQVTVDFRFSGSPEEMTVRLSSNLDELFASRMKSIIEEQTEKVRAKIEQRIQDELEPRKQKVIKRYEENREKLNQEIAKIENKINEKKQLLELKKQELETRLEAEKKKQEDQLKEKIKEKTQEKLKDLFRR